MNAAIERPRRRPLNVADYHRMAEVGILAPDERVELIDGEIIAMPPIGPVHASFVDELSRLLWSAVGDRAILRVQGPVRLSDLSEPEPDIALLRFADDAYRSAHPGPDDTLLAIEVSDSTLEHDRHVKAALYARHAIPEYWLVDVQGRRLVVHRRPDDRGYDQVSEHPLAEPLSPVALPDVTLDLSALFGADLSPTSPNGPTSRHR